MDNNDIEFDNLLTAALYRAAELDYGDIPSDEELEQILHISPQYKSKMDMFFSKKRKKANQKQRRPIYAKLMQTAAVLLVTFTLLLGTLMLVSPTVRAEVIRFVRTWFEDRTEYFTPDYNNIIDKEWSFEYIPDGFELLDASETELQLFHVYQNSDNSLLMISISDGRQIIDNEHSELSHAVLENGNSVDIYESNDSIYPSIIIVFDEASRLIITITSELPINELLMIAENIK